MMTWPAFLCIEPIFIREFARSNGGLIQIKIPRFNAFHDLARQPSGPTGRPESLKSIVRPCQHVGGLDSWRIAHIDRGDSTNEMPPWKFLHDLLIVPLLHQYIQEWVAA